MTTKAYSYIRFSSPEQQKGDSLRRQLEKSQAYAAKHDLELDTTLNMRDLGVSAFRKANIEKGNLGAFIEAIEKGMVKPGSYLLVESLDRLSRAEVVDALRIFLNIIEHEIIIVTLADDRLYSRESIRNNSVELIVSIAVMMRSHDESMTKSVRRKASGERQRKELIETGKKLSRKTHFWLSLASLYDEYVVDEDGAAAVRLIFKLAQQGLGYLRISQKLNELGIKSPAARLYKKPDRVDRGWGTSSVAHVLNSEAVIGFYRVRDKSGKEVLKKTHYPLIIDEALFYEVRPNAKAKGGRTTKYNTNLFTHRLFCGYCHGAMQVDAGKNKDGGRRSNMICQNGRRAYGCVAKAWHYENFEEAFFTFVREVDVSTLIGRKTVNVSLEQKIGELRGRISKNEATISKYLAQFEEGDTPTSMIKRLRELESEQVELELELRDKLLELDDQLHLLPAELLRRNLAA